MAKSTSKMDFFDKNREMAEGLATQEFADAKEKAKETQVSWLIIDNKHPLRNIIRELSSSPCIGLNWLELSTNYDILKPHLQAQKDEKELLYNTIIDVNRKQYAKLLTLERKEMQNQKEISDTWIKFVFLLIESTLQYCEENQKLFHNLDEYAQTLLLREQANLLRSQCNLPSYEVSLSPVSTEDAMNLICWQCWVTY